MTFGPSARWMSAVRAARRSRRRGRGARPWSGATSRRGRSRRRGCGRTPGCRGGRARRGGRRRCGGRGVGQADLEPAGHLAAGRDVLDVEEHGAELLDPRGQVAGGEVVEPDLPARVERGRFGDAGGRRRAVGTSSPRIAACLRLSAAMTGRGAHPRCGTARPGRLPAARRGSRRGRRARPRRRGLRDRAGVDRDRGAALAVGGGEGLAGRVGDGGPGAGRRRERRIAMIAS